MAHFHFCTANHNITGQATLNDMFDWFNAGLQELGHKVTISNNYVDPNAINIFWENFNPKNAEIISNLNIQYGIVATEIPDGNAFNWRNEDFWKTRFDAFKLAAKNASFIWTMVESTIPYYQQFCPTAFINFGFSKLLIPDYINQKPSFDFCFYGLMTPYRSNIIDKIRKYAHVEYPKKFLNSVEVHSLIASCKVGINFKQSENWPIPSPTRLGRLLMAQRGIAAEYVPISTMQGEIAQICPENEDFIEYSMKQLDNWKLNAEYKFEQYSALMPMKKIMEEAIEKTIKNEMLFLMKSQKSMINLSGLEPPKLIKSIKNYNIIEWKNQFYAIHYIVGAINLETLHDEQLRKFSSVKFIISENLDKLEEIIARQNKILLFIYSLRNPIIKLIKFFK